MTWCNVENKIVDEKERDSTRLLSWFKDGRATYDLDCKVKLILKSTR